MVQKNGENSEISRYLHLNRGQFCLIFLNRILVIDGQYVAKQA